MALHWFPHRYRIEVMNQNVVYRRWRRACPMDETPFVRVIRDPYKRAVSSFHSAVTNQRICRADISVFLGRELTQTDGFSFNEFLDFLESIDIAACDRHISQQFNALEDWVSPALLINADADDLHQGLNEFETMIGVPRADFESSPLADAIRKARQKHVTRRFDPGHDFTGELLGSAGVEGLWPSYESLLTQETRRRIENIYVRDFEAYSNYLQ